MKHQKIGESAKNYTNECKEFLKDIISIRSVSCEEKEVVQRISEEMKKVGFDEIKIDGLGNILGRVGNGPTVIAMDSHIDTVDVGDPELWDHDPFDPVEKDGIIYGRGASDQKGGIAAMVYAAKIIKEQNLDKDCTVWMVGSVMEEDCDGLCWQYIIKEKVINPEVVVLTEPTNLNLYRGHRGRMEIEVETKGISCHGSDPTRGDNAVTKMAPVITQIDQLNKDLKPTEFLGKGTVAISHIRSTSPSLCAVADSCTIHLDRRLTEGEDETVAVNQLKELPGVKNSGARIKVLDYAAKAYTGLVYPTKKFYPTWTLGEEHMAVQAGKAAADDILQREVIIDKWVFSTNGVATAGMFNIPTIGFGPANEIYAHSVADQIPIEHLEKAIGFYAAFVAEYMEAKNK
ncbi:MAG: YgeY family selenium metabolism-linked hydrolase [Deltaproteobacteria bacterium]|nr:YgeY family selenium metabolism-linked hydrolase [Deltaproteobacteria bacterium]